MAEAVTNTLQNCRSKRSCESNWANLVMREMHREDIEFEGVSGRVGLKNYQTKYPAVRAFYYQNWSAPAQLLTANTHEVKLVESFDWSDWKNTSEILGKKMKKTGKTSRH